MNGPQTPLATGLKPAEVHPHVPEVPLGKIWRSGMTLGHIKGFMFALIYLIENVFMGFLILVLFNRPLSFIVLILPHYHFVADLSPEAIALELSGERKGIY